MNNKTNLNQILTLALMFIAIMIQLHAGMRIHEALIANALIAVAVMILPTPIKMQK